MSLCGCQSSSYPAIRPPFVVGHLARAVYTDDAVLLLLIYEEQHPTTIGFAKQQQIVTDAPTGLWIGKAALSLPGGDIVLSQELVLVVFIPVELGQKAPALTSVPHLVGWSTEPQEGI
jgi:hypothetical protein